jgi:hypothetical protein
MATGSPANLRRKDRFELFFDRRAHGQAFDDHFLRSGPGDRVKVIRVFSASATNSGSFGFVPYGRLTKRLGPSFELDCAWLRTR